MDGVRIQAGVWVPLREHSRIRFGARVETWWLASARPPEAYARELSTGDTRFAEDGVIVFEPESAEPQVGILDAESGCFWFPVDGARRQVRDGALLTVGGRSWRLVFPPEQARAAAGDLASQDITLLFEVSSDEESVRLCLDTGRAIVPLRSRSFDYMLLCLARARIEDERTGDLPPEDQGWVDTVQLARSLSMDPAHLNVDVHRARRHFAAAGIAEPERTVERRTAARQLRLGFAQLAVGRPPR